MICVFEFAGHVIKADELPSVILLPNGNLDHYEFTNNAKIEIW